MYMELSLHRLECWEPSSKTVTSMMGNDEGDETSSARIRTYFKRENKRIWNFEHIPAIMTMGYKETVHTSPRLFTVWA